MSESSFSVPPGREPLFFGHPLSRIPKFRHSHTFWLSVVLLVFVTGFAGLRARRTQLSMARGSRSVDFETFYRAAEVASQRGDIYRFYRSSEVYPYLYPPFLAAALRPMSFLSLDHAVLLWSLFQLLLVLVGFELLRRFFVMWNSPVPDLLASGLVALHLWPLVDNFAWMQVNLVVWVAALAALVLVMRGRAWWGGGALAVAVAIKVLPVLFLLALVWLDGRTVLRFLGGFAVGLVVFLGVVPAIVGGGYWALDMNEAYAAMMLHAARSAHPALAWGNNCANHSLLYGFYHMIGICAPKSVHRDLNLVTSLYSVFRSVLFVGLVVPFVVGVVIRIRWLLGRGNRNRTVERRLFLLTLGQVGLGVLLVSPIVWIHHWILAVLPTAAFIAVGLPHYLRGEVGEKSNEALSWVGSIGALVGIFLVGVMVGAQPFEAFQHGALAFVWYGAWVVTTIALLVAQGWVLSQQKGARSLPSQRLAAGFGMTGIRR